jgi:hypothetical protein
MNSLLKSFNPSRFSAALTLLAALLVCCAPVWAQNAVVSGRVTDSSGAVVPNATVELTRRTTQVKSTTVTNAQGLFVYPSVVPGTYDITASLLGFTTSRIEAVKLEVGQSKTLDFTLTPGKVNQTVNVVDRAPLVTSDRADVGTVVENQFIESIPLLTRNPLLLGYITPGTIGTATPGGGLTAGDNTVSENQTNYFSINGGRERTADLLIDGATDTAEYNVQAAAIPQMESLREFKIITDPYDVEIGHTGGGIMSYTLKSGTNDFHGTVWEYLQNQVLDANGFNGDKAGTPKGRLQKNQFGFDIGGPMTIPKLFQGKDRAFFFFAYEGLRQNSFSSFTGTVPTAAESQGNFSHMFNSAGALTVMYDPSTTQANPAVPGTYIRTAFPGNVIPSTELNSIATNILKYFPPPNQQGIGQSDTNNYFSPAPSTLDDNRYDSRIDFQLSNKHSVFAHGLWFGNLNSSPNVYNSPESPVNTPNMIPGWQAALGDAWTISPSTVLVHHFSLADTQTNRIPLTLGFDDASLGFPSSLASGLQAKFFPTISVGGTSGVGANGTIYNSVISRTWQYAAALTILRGKHTIKTGFDYRFYSTHWFNPQDLSISSSGSFTGGPNPQAATSNTGSGIADLLLGVASVSYQLYPLNVYNHPYYAAYGQDEWRATRNLTVTYGVRYNLELGDKENSNHYVYLDTTSASPLQVPGYNLVGGIAFAGVNGHSIRPQAADLTNWDPRFGLAYRIGDKTSVRAGFGIFHNPMQSTSINATYGYSQTTSNIIAQPNGVTPNFNLSNPFPSGLTQPTGNTLGLATNLGLSIAAPLHQIHTPYTELWSAEVERQLPYKMMIGLGYTGSHGIHLPSVVALDQLPMADLALGTQLTQTVANPFYGLITNPSSTLSAATVVKSQLLRPYPQFTGMNVNMDPAGISSYNAMILRVERRFANGVALLFNYTWSKSMDNVGDYSSIDNAYCIYCDRSVSGWNTPQEANLSGRYELPFGSGKKLLDHGFASKVLGNWAVAGIYSYSSGFPVAVSSPDNSDGYDIGSFRPDATGVHASLPGGPQITNNGEYFNPAAFSRTPQFQFGNVSRYLGDVRNPPNFGLNALLEKQVIFHERYNVSFHAEFLNATNSVNFAGPQTGITSSAFGTISLTQVNNPRTIQFALRVGF